MKPQPDEPAAPPPPDPIGDLKKRLRRVEQLWDIQKGRANAVADPRDKKDLQHLAFSGDNLGPRLADGWSSALARSVALREAMREGKSRRDEYAANPLEQARWARADAALTNFLRFKSVPPGLADDSRPRGKPVRSWATTTAIDALPSDAMRQREFRMTCTQMAYQYAVADQRAHQHVVRKARPGKLADV